MLLLLLLLAYPYGLTIGNILSTKVMQALIHRMWAGFEADRSQTQCEQQKIEVAPSMPRASLMPHAVRIPSNIKKACQLTCDGPEQARLPASRLAHDEDGLALCQLQIQGLAPSTAGWRYHWP